MQVSEKCLFSSHMAHPAIYSLTRFPWHDGMLVLARNSARCKVKCCRNSARCNVKCYRNFARCNVKCCRNSARCNVKCAEILHAVTSSAAVLLKRAKSNSGRYIPDDDRDDHDDKKIEQLN